MATTNLGSVSLFFSSRKQTNYLVPRLMTSSWSRITHRSSSSRCYHDKSLKAVTPSIIDDPCDKNRQWNRRFLARQELFHHRCNWVSCQIFIEKLLRETPEIGKIFLLIKAKDLEEAKKRLYDEIISSDLFKLLKQKHGKSYDAFLKNKLIPIVGDIAEDNLGMDSEISSKISEEIDVIISSAARTTFDDRYDLALSINALGPGRLLIFAKKCKKLNLFLHFSTAYVTGKRQGTILETPLCIGKNITSDLNIETELRLAEEALRNFHGNGEVQKMKELGIERAQIHGWENTYTFTKAMGETAIHSNRGDLPVVIIRPSIIESSYSEPFPGWIQGFRMADPVILAYGKGQLPGFWGDPQALVDIVPVDMVVNAAIAAMANHGDCVTELKVYNVTSSLVNPLRFRELMDLALQHLRDYPLTETTIKPIEFHRSMEDFTSCISKTIAKQEIENNLGGGESDSTLSIKGKKKLKYFVAMAKIYEPYAFFQARFDDSNTRRLLKEMSMEDRKMFEFDVRGIDWEHYFVNVHLPGLKRHLINGRFG